MAQNYINMIMNEQKIVNIQVWVILYSVGQANYIQQRSIFLVKRKTFKIQFIKIVEFLFFFS